MVGMPDETEFEYAKMKDFLSFYAERYLNTRLPSGRREGGQGRGLRAAVD